MPLRYDIQGSQLLSVAGVHNYLGPVLKAHVHVDFLYTSASSTRISVNIKARLLLVCCSVCW